MNLKVYSIYDTKTSSFSRPFYEHHDHQARRGVAKAVGEGNNGISDYPGDFALMCLGSWDDQTASFTIIQPLNLGSCAEIFASEMTASHRARNSQEC